MLATTTDELAARFRSDVDDLVTDVNGSDFGCLWKNADVYAYMTAACDRLAKDTEALYKTLLLPVRTGEAVVRCPTYVTDIRSARLVQRNQSVCAANTNSGDYGFTRDYGIAHHGAPAMFDSSGIPEVFIRDYEKKALRLVPIPSEDDTLEVQCATTLSLPQEACMPLPFMDTGEQILLLEYMKYLAYRKHDAETENLVRSESHKATYDRDVLDRKYELQRYRRRPPVMRMGY